MTESCSPPVIAPPLAVKAPVMKLALLPGTPDTWNTYVPSARVGAAAVISTLTEADLVGSVTEVIVRVTDPPEGIVVGAV